MSRANWLPAPQYFNLNRACVAVNEGLGDFACYLVGSSLHRRDFRDVDVRHIMPDANYDALFPAGGGAFDPFWSLLCQSISLYLSQQSGLPVDFQIQRQTDANETYPEQTRSALGIFLGYPGEVRPKQVKP